MRNKTIIAALIILIASSCKKDPAYEPQSQTSQFPDSLSVGDLQIHNFYDSKYLLVNNSWTIKEYKVNHGIFHIPASDLHIAGTYDFTFLDADHRVTERRKSYVLSAAPHSKIETYLTYPYITAGTDEVSETVVVPIDVYGNLLDYAVDVNINFQSENKTKSEVKNSQYNYSTAALYSQSRTMEIPYSILTPYTYSQNYSLHIEPGPPANLDLQVFRKTDFSDAQQSIFIEGKNIRDANGNIVQDGTMITFVVKNANSKSEVTGLVIKGSCVSEFIAPDQAGMLEVYATSKNKIIGKQVSVKFQPVHLSTRAFVYPSAVDIAYMSPNMGQYVEDGTPASLVIYSDTDTFQIKQQTEFGKVRIDRDKYRLHHGRYQYSSRILGNEYKGTFIL